MSSLVFNGPAEFEMQVLVVHDDTGVSGRVTIGLGIFEYPSQEKVAARIARFEAEELVGALDGFRLMTKEEAWMTAMYEKTGERFSMVGSKDWDPLPVEK